MGFCIVGNVVIAPRQAARRAIYYDAPQITYKANSSDKQFWGFDYTTFNGEYSFVPGYSIFESDEASCTLGGSGDGGDGDGGGGGDGGGDGSGGGGSGGGGSGGGDPPPPPPCPQGMQCLDPVNYCPPGKVCIPSAEWSQITKLANQLRNRNCK